MKKYSLLLLAFVMIIILVSCTLGIEDNGEQHIIEYCTAINKLLAEEDFVTANLSNGSIILFDSEKEIIKEVTFPNYDKSLDIIYMRKEGNIIYFVTSRSVDDENGYMFINGEENKVFDGLWSAERVTGNGYAYSTAK